MKKEGGGDTIDFYRTRSVMLYIFYLLGECKYKIYNMTDHPNGAG